MEQNTVLVIVLTTLLGVLALYLRGVINLHFEGIRELKARVTILEEKLSQMRDAHQTEKDHWLKELESERDQRQAAENKVTRFQEMLDHRNKQVESLQREKEALEHRLKEAQTKTEASTDSS